MSSRSRRGGLALIGSVAASLVLAACSSSSGGSGDGATASAASNPECKPYSAYQGHAGKTVKMFGSILSPESDSLNKSWAEFSKCTGIKIAYEGSNDFESQLPVRVQGGNAPDLAIIPQPGLVARLANNAKPAPKSVEDNVDKYWNPAWKQYATVNGKFYGAPMSANMKSLVWYSPKAFKDAGYTVPETWADMMSLSDKIAAAGKVKPWCGGIGSGTATGWPATDWLEEIVLGTYGGQTYDDWVSHKVKFSSPEITDAMKTLDGWYHNDKYVNGGFGGVQSIATTTFQDAGKPILNGQCYMLQQASFYAAQWPQGTNVGPDGDVWAFKLPAVKDSVKTPVEGGGEFLVAFSDDPAVQAVQTYLSTPDWATSRIKVAPGWVSANTGVDQSVYTTPIDQLSAKYLTNKDATFRFDASDLMPAQIGAGAEWKEMTAYFGSGQSIEKTLSNIDQAWPSS
ncbi:MAG: ABC transporter substrate-binding protein [Actinomycetales bacterium]